MNNCEDDDKSDKKSTNTQEYSENQLTHAAFAGGLNAISEVLSGLPANFFAAIAIVQHLDPRHRSLMADILSRRTSLQVKLFSVTSTAIP